jgi:hypothetical protein
VLRPAALLGAALTGALTLGCVVRYPEPPHAVAPPPPAPLVIIVITGDPGAVVATVEPEEAPPAEVVEVAPPPVEVAPPPIEVAPPPVKVARLPALPPREVALAPRWRGTWRDAAGHRYAFDLSLRREAGGRVEGYFDWELLEAPAGSPQALRVHQTGRELVRGTYDARARRLELSGYRVSNPILLATDRYRVVLDEGGAVFRGNSLGAGDAWSSTLEARAALGAGARP